jgi:DNA-binding NtrC family response regulator
MKPIWIVDDDQSIRFVLEKALAREQFAVRSFSSPRDVLAGAGRRRAAGAGQRHPHARRLSGIDLLARSSSGCRGCRSSS